MSFEMNCYLIWILILVMQACYVTSRPVQDTAAITHTGQLFYSDTDENAPKDEKVISVRITSSVAVGRGNGKPIQRTADDEHGKELPTNSETTSHLPEINENNNQDLPANLKGANIEYLKQLNAKKELNYENNGNFQTSQLRYDDSDKRISYETKNEQSNTNERQIQSASDVLSSDDFTSFRAKSISVLDEALKLANDRLDHDNTDSERFTGNKPATEDALSSTLYEDSEFDGEEPDHNKAKDIGDSIAESSIKSEISNKQSDDYENIENVPLARSLTLHSSSSKKYIQGLNNIPPSERESSTRLTTVSFNIVHDSSAGFIDPATSHVNPAQSYLHQKLYQSPTIYSKPAQIYSEPAKVYSEPAKVYSEPAKIYSEPAKVYSEPAKVYSEPAKFYSEPASLHLKPSRNYSPWKPPLASSTIETTTITATTTDTKTTELPQEKNYEVDENISILTDGRSHGVQEPTTEKCKQDNCKVGYVVKGRQFNKYRVEERTSDGFIVGEYGVVRNEDGALRGVRYTADSEASPRLIYDALMKFLQLK